jgi:signal transduction histidine kinase
MNIFSVHKSPLFIKIVFVIAIFIMLFVSALTYRHVESLTSSSKLVAHTYRVTVEIEQLYTNIKDLEIERRNYLLTNNTNLIQNILSSKLKISKNLIRIQNLIKYNSKQESLLKELEKLITEKFVIVDQAVKPNEILTVDNLKSNLLEGKKVMDKIDVFVKTMLDIEKKLLIERTENNATITDTTPIIIYFTLFSTIAIITLAFIKISRDLEEMRKNNEQLALNNESNNLAEQIGDYGTWFLNIETNKYTFSENEYRLLGVNPYFFDASLEGFLQYIHPEDLQYVKDISKNMVGNDILVPFTYRIIRADGELRFLRGNGKIVTNKSGERILIGTTSDVTDEVIAKKAIEERNRELEANNKELQAFNYVASHDLQEPLRKIQTFISRLVDKDLLSLSENSQQFLLKIQDSTQRMRVLIDDLLQFSRANKAEKVFEKTNLNELVENSKHELAQIIEDKNATIISDELPTLNVIPFQIQQLFSNLINNSLKYCRENVTPFITIKLDIVDAAKEETIPIDEKRNYYKITFTDNGIGFDSEYSQKIFLLFNRLHNKNEYSGTGIGLAICKKIVENHKGFIVADGQTNIGATFTIYLPFD